MPFSLKELVKGIINANIDDDDKTKIIIDAIQCSNLFDGYYLRRDEFGYLHIWHRYNYKGKVINEPTNYGVEDIVEMLNKSEIKSIRKT